MEYTRYTNSVSMFYMDVDSEFVKAISAEISKRNLGLLTIIKNQSSASNILDPSAHHQPSEKTRWRSSSGTQNQLLTQ